MKPLFAFCLITLAICSPLERKSQLGKKIITWFKEIGHVFRLSATFVHFFSESREWWFIFHFFFFLQTRPEGFLYLERARDNYQNYDFESRLTVRIHSALRYYTLLTPK